MVGYVNSSLTMSNPDSAYNVRVQYADRIDWHTDMNTKVNTLASIHSEQLWFLVPMEKYLFEHIDAHTIWKVTMITQR